MAEFYRDQVLAESLEQPFEIAPRVGVVLEAGRELREKRAELVRRRERIDRAAELVDIGLSEAPRIAAGRLLEHLRVSELLIELQRELEATGRAVRPALRGGG